MLALGKNMKNETKNYLPWVWVHTYLVLLQWSYMGAATPAAEMIIPKVGN